MRFFQILCFFVLISTVTRAQETGLLNSPYDEQNPVLAPDQQTLYFTMSNHPQNIDGFKDPGDIWFTKKMPNGNWGSPQHAGPEINSIGWDGVLGFNAEGNLMYLHNHYSAKKTAKTQGISLSRKTGSQWSEPENIIIPYFKNLSSPQTGWLSADEKIMILSIESFSTLGAEDLYLLKKDGSGNWGDARHLGWILNTPYQEISPSYSKEDSLLYFASNGHGGSGSFDIFYSKRLDDTWQNWSPPLALGDTINTAGRETGFSNYPSYNFAIFSSTQNSDGYGDIRIHRYGDEIIPEIEGRRILVIDSRTGDFINAEIILVDEKQRQQIIRTDEQGVDISDFAVGIYEMTVTAPGFLSVEEELEVTTEGKQHTVALQPLETGTRMVLENVLFVQSKDVLLPESNRQLNLVVRLMKENPGLKIRLEGHTDGRGSPKANVRLSRMRAQAVEDYLVKKGINKNRIEGIGFGGEQPLYPNDTEENRRKNRRVEFVIID